MPIPDKMNIAPLVASTFSTTGNKSLNHKDFAKQFITANNSQKKQLLSSSSNKEKSTLFRTLRQHYNAAGSLNSKKNCSESILFLSVDLVRNMPQQDSNVINNNVINVLKFMQKNLSYAGEIRNAKPRDAAQWSGLDVLSEGNFNGCVEATKLFMVLMKGVSSGSDIKYISSFSLKGAERIRLESAKPKGQRNIELIKNPPGHAMVEIKENSTGRKFIVDATMFSSPVVAIDIKESDILRQNKLGANLVTGAIKQFPSKADVLIQKKGNGYTVKLYDYGRLSTDLKEQHFFSDLKELNSFIENRFYRNTVSFNDLVNAGIVKQENDGCVQLEAGEYTGQYVIFEKTPEPPYTSQYGPNGSSTKTLEAIKQYYRSQK